MTLETTNRFAEQNRSLAELSAHWPMSQADLLNWFNGPAMSLSDAEYGSVLAKLKEGGLTQVAVRSLLEIPFLETSA